MKVIKWGVEFAPESGKLFLVYETTEPAVFKVKVVDGEDIQKYVPSTDDLLSDTGLVYGYCEHFALETFIREQFPQLEHMRERDFRRKITERCFYIGTTKVAVIDN